MRESDFAGVILAGGKSSRFGSNKALTLFQKRRLIEYPAEILELIFKNRLLVTNTPGEYSFLDWPITGDIFPGKGPLAGIHAALTTLATPYIFIVGCDMPFPSRLLITYLCELAPEFDAVIPVADHGLEPLHSVYSRTALPILEKSLRDNELKMSEVLERMNIRKVESDEIKRITGSEQPFRNINTISDLNNA